MLYQAIISAAGMSTRMGKPKAFLKYNEDQTFVDYLVQKYLDLGVQKIFLVKNKNHWPDKWVSSGQCVEIIIQPRPEEGAFSSVSLGIEKVDKSLPVFIHPVDCPFLSGNLIMLMIEKLIAGSYIVPTYQQKGGHPVLISPQILEKWDSTNAVNKRLDHYLRAYQKIQLPVTESKVLLNINTNEDYLDFIGMINK